MSDFDGPQGPIRGPESWFTSDEEPQRDLTLPHWTEPGTGQAEASEGGGPRWRDGASDYNELDDIRLLDPTPPPAMSAEEAAGEVFFGLDVDGGPHADPGASPGSSAAAVTPPPAPEAPAPTGARAQRARAARRATAPGPTGQPDAQTPNGPSDRNVALAVLTGVGLAIVGLASLWLGEVPALIVSSAVLAFAAAEFFNAMRTVGYKPATLVGIAATVGLNVAVYWKSAAGYPVVLFLAVLCTMLWFLTGPGKDRPVPNLGITFFGIAYIGVLGSFAGLLLSSDSLVENDITGASFESYGTGLLFAAILATVGYDVGAWFIGRSIGRTPLSAHSPNKTLEGVLGGALVSIVLSALVLGIFSIEPWGAGPGGVGDTIILGVVAAIAATLGDLCESMIKRDLGVKDMGAILPGHGGLLDRFDGLLFVMPAVWCAGLALNILEATSAVRG